MQAYGSLSQSISKSIYQRYCEAFLNIVREATLKLIRSLPLSYLTARHTLWLGIFHSLLSNIETVLQQNILKLGKIDSDISSAIFQHKE